MIATAIAANSGASSDEPDASTSAMSIARLSKSDERARRAGGSPSSGRPSAAWIVAWGPSTSKSRGTMSTCTSSSFSSRIELERLGVRRLREGDDHALDVELGRRSPAVPIGAQDGQVAEAVAPLARVLVDEADEVDAVLGVLQQLARHLLADVPGADDRACSGRTRPVPADARARSCGRPGRARSRAARRAAASGSSDRRTQHVGEREEHPRADRDHVEDAEEVVDRRVVGALLVARVQAVEAREHDPDRQRQREEKDLDLRADAVVRHVVAAKTTCVTTKASRMPITSAPASARRTSQPRRCTVAAAAALDQRHACDRRRGR